MRTPCKTVHFLMWEVPAGTHQSYEPWVRLEAGGCKFSLSNKIFSVLEVTTRQNGEENNQGNKTKALKKKDKPINPGSIFLGIIFLGNNSNKRGKKLVKVLLFSPSSKTNCISYGMIVENSNKAMIYIWFPKIQVAALVRSTQIPWLIESFPQCPVKTLNQTLITMDRQA